MSKFLSFMGFKGWIGLHLWALHLFACLGLYIYPHPFEPHALWMFKSVVLWIGSIIFFNPFINAWTNQRHLEEMADFYQTLRAMEELKRKLFDTNNHTSGAEVSNKNDLHASDENARKFWERIRSKRNSASKLPDTSTEAPMPNVKPPKRDRYSHDGQGYQPEGPRPKVTPKGDNVTGQYSYKPERLNPPASPPPKKSKPVSRFFEFLKNVRDYDGLLLRLSKQDEYSRPPPRNEYGMTEPDPIHSTYTAQRMYELDKEQLAHLEKNKNPPGAE